MGKSKQKTSLKTSIEQTINYLKDYFKIKEVILFGSRATDQAGKYSDIDLMVISPDFKGKSFEEIVNIFSDLAVKCNPYVELRAYTPEEVKKARPTNFLGHILKNGKVVYKGGKLLI